MLKNVPAYLHSRKELYSSVFQEIHENRFFLKEFMQPILYGVHYYRVFQKKYYMFLKVYFLTYCDRNITKF